MRSLLCLRGLARHGCSINICSIKAHLVGDLEQLTHLFLSATCARLCVGSRLICTWDQVPGRTRCRGTDPVLSPTGTSRKVPPEEGVGDQAEHRRGHGTYPQSSSVSSLPSRGPRWLLRAWLPQVFLWLAASPPTSGPQPSPLPSGLAAARCASSQLPLRRVAEHWNWQG